MKIFVIPDQKGCLWVQDGSATRALKEASDGIQPIPSNLEQPIIEWCSAIRQGNWGAFDYTAEEFFAIGRLRIQVLANWLPPGWAVVLDLDDFPHKFAEQVRSSKLVEFTRQENP